MLKLELHENPKKHIYKRLLKPVSKVHYLFSLCSEHSLYLKNEDKLCGVLDILSGLEYHIKKIKNLEKIACKHSNHLNLLKKAINPSTYLNYVNIIDIMMQHMNR